MRTAEQSYSVFNDFRHAGGRMAHATISLPLLPETRCGSPAFSNTRFQSSTPWRTYGRHRAGVKRQTCETGLALRWGKETTCSRYGPVVSVREPVEGEKGKSVDCCNHLAVLGRGVGAREGVERRRMLQVAREPAWPERAATRGASVPPWLCPWMPMRRASMRGSGASGLGAQSPCDVRANAKAAEACHLDGTK